MCNAPVAGPGWAVRAEFEGQARMGFTYTCPRGQMLLRVCDEGVGLSVGGPPTGPEQVWVRWSELDRPWVSGSVIGWGSGPVDSYAFCPPERDWAAVEAWWKAKCPDVLFWHVDEDVALGQPRTFVSPPTDSGGAESPGRVLYRLSKVLPSVILAALVVLVFVPQFGFSASWGRGEPQIVWLTLVFAEGMVVSAIVLDLMMRRVTGGTAAAAVRPGPHGMSNMVGGGLLAAVLFSTVAIILTIRSG